MNSPVISSAPGLELSGGHVPSWTTRPSRLFLLLLWLCISTPAWGWALEIEKVIQDRMNEAEESSGLSKKDRRFVPVPIPVSNPNLDSGLALAGLYLHPQRKGDSVSPTSITAVLGMGTSNGSWGAGVGHSGYYSEDKYRLSGGLAYGEFNLKFYGVGEDSILADRPVEYEAAAFAFAPMALFRLPVNNWFLGARYLYMHIENTFDFSNLLPRLPEIRIPTKTAGLGLVTSYDSRNDTLWPTKGGWFELTITDYDELFGGDFEYRKYRLKFSQYFPLTKTITFSYRLDGQSIEGRPPFYDLSSLNVRGFPTGRFSDRNAVSAQVETRWNFTERWTALVFGGGGRIAPRLGDLDSSSTHYAGGVGLRYLVAKAQNLNVGVDITYGAGEANFYVQIGDWFGR